MTEDNNNKTVDYKAKYEEALQTIKTLQEEKAELRKELTDTVNAHNNIREELMNVATDQLSYLRRTKMLTPDQVDALKEQQAAAAKAQATVGK